MDPNNSNNVSIAGAIAYPRAAEGEVVPAPVQPRQPQNLQGLLRFAMEARQEDPPAQVQLAPMDEDRRAFLEQALQSMVMNVVDVLKQNIPVLLKVDSLDGQEEITDEVKNAFNNIADVIDDVDVANDFCKIGGFEVFDVCYNVRNTELWVYTNDLLAGVCQNFPYGQELALERGLLKQIIELLRDPQTKHKEKFVYALSCCVREYPPGCRELVARGGCELLAPFLAETQPSALEEQRLKTKVACLLRHLFMNNVEARAKITALNLPQILVPQLTKIGESTEHLLNLLRSYISPLTPEVTTQCKSEALGLKKVLEKVLNTPCIMDDEDMNREIIEYATEVLSIVYDETAAYDCEEEADR